MLGPRNSDDLFFFALPYDSCFRKSVRTLVDESERFVGQTPRWEM